MSDLRENQDDTIVLTDEEGTEHEFTLVDILEVQDREYAVLLPPEEAEADEDEECEAVILRIDREEDGSEVLVDIEDDEEWQRVAGAWDELVEEELAEFDDEQEAED